MGNNKDSIIISLLKSISKCLDTFIIPGQGGGSSEGNSLMGETFTTNTPVGGIVSNTTINANETIQSIIKRMLLTLKKAVAYSPTCAIKQSGGIVEYGTKIKTIFDVTYTDGSFDEYVNNSINNIDAECDYTGTSWYKKSGSSEYTSYSNDSESEFTVNSVTTIKAVVSYDSSTAKPKNSDGKVTESIPAGTAEATCTYTPKYYYFYGSADTVPTDVRATATKSFTAPKSIDMTGTKMYLYVQKDLTQPKLFGAKLEDYSIVEETADNTNATGQALKKEVKVKNAAGVDVNYYRYLIQSTNAGGVTINITY